MLELNSQAGEKDGPNEIISNNNNCRAAPGKASGSYKNQVQVFFFNCKKKTRADTAQTHGPTRIV